MWPNMQIACMFLHCHMWHVRLLHVSTRYFINHDSGEKKILNIECAFWFCLQCLSETFSHFKKNSTGHSLKCTNGFTPRTRYSCNDLMLGEFSRQTFQKYSTIKLHEIPSSESRVLPCRQRDMRKLIAAFRTFKKAHNKMKSNIPKSTEYCKAGCFVPQIRLCKDKL
jgi:hypothetical protein